MPPQTTLPGLTFGDSAFGFCVVCQRESGANAFCSEGCRLAAQDANRLLLETIKGTLTVLYNLCTCAMAAVLLPLVVLRAFMRRGIYRAFHNSVRRGELLHVLLALLFLGAILGGTVATCVTDANWRAVTGCQAWEACEVVATP